jgi:small subunit ribosomal protein S20
MTHSKQAAKRVRTSNQARLRNVAVKTAIKSSIKRTLKATTPEQQHEALRAAMKRVDKAAKSGVIHKNTAARRKSRLMRALNRAKANTVVTAAR